MKNYFILTMILIAGMTAYPQATRTERGSKSEKAGSKKEARAAERKTVTRSESKPARQVSVERSKPVQSRQEVTRPRQESRSNDQNNVRRSNESARTRETVRSNEQKSAVRESNQVERRNDNQVRTRVQDNSGRRSETGNSVQRQQNTITRPENRSGGNDNSNRVSRNSGNSDPANDRIKTSSATRVYREGRGTLTRDDGTVMRHQNDEVFKSRRYRLDFDNYENLRRSDEFRRDYRDYDDWYHRRTIRIVNHYHYSPLSFEMRRARFYYRQPRHIDLIWTPLLFHRFMYYYPENRNWEMEFGSQIETIPADEAQQYTGAVRRVYGKVDEVYYSPEDENYILYIGAPFPYQDISVVIPKDIARNISLSPKWYFEHEFVWVVGLIDTWEGKPELIVRDEDQIQKY